jgi:hypothetical protein
MIGDALSEDSLRRIAAADDLLTTALARLPSSVRMRHAPTVGVVKVLFGDVRNQPATAPPGSPDDWTELLDRLEPQLDLCEAVATVADLKNQFIILDERIGRLWDDIAALGAVVEPHSTAQDRLVRLTLRAQQEILELAGAQLDRKLSRIEAALARHRSTDETRTGEFYRVLREFEVRLDRQSTEQTTDYDLRMQKWNDELSTLTSQLRKAADVERAEQINRFFEPTERQEQARVTHYGRLFVGFLIVAILAAGFGFYAHETTQSAIHVAGSVTLFTLLSSSAGLMRKEKGLHLRRLWALQQNHERVVGSLLLHQNITDSQLERLVEEYFTSTSPYPAPRQASDKPKQKDKRSVRLSFPLSEKDR